MHEPAAGYETRLRGKLQFDHVQLIQRTSRVRNWQAQERRSYAQIERLNGAEGTVTSGEAGSESLGVVLVQLLDVDTA